MKYIIYYILSLSLIAGCATTPQSPVDKCGTDKDYIYDQGECVPVSNEDLYGDAFGENQEPVPMTEGYEQD